MQAVNSQNGFTLIEVLVSILITSVALVGLVAMQAKGVGYSVDAEDRNEAVLLANEMVTTMWLYGTNDNSDSDLSSEISTWKTKVQTNLPPYSSDDDEVNAEVGDVDDDGVATITVTWTPVGLAGTQHKYVTQVAM